MFQKELGEKIVSKFPSSNYGRLSILANYKLEIKNKFFISANCFFPKPKVTSMVIHFKPKFNSKYKINNLENLEKITNIFFTNKRKMINKSLKKILTDSQIKKISNLKVSSRPSEISLKLIIKLLN